MHFIADPFYMNRLCLVYEFRLGNEKGARVALAWSHQKLHEEAVVYSVRTMTPVGRRLVPRALVLNTNCPLES